MDTLYPNLYERFKTEGLCPICLMEMELTLRYSCANGHTMCYRCKPYYYGCPICAAPLDVEILPPKMDGSLPVHLTSHPVSLYRYDNHDPSAPSINDFLDHERRTWEPPVPSENLESCSYSHLGCWVKIPEHLRTLHESRCQFRPHLKEEHVATDLYQDDLIDCSYSIAGCKVRTVPWRRSIHEQYCIYKDRFQSMNDVNEDLTSATTADNNYDGDPEELMQCKFKRYGCMVKMPRRRKYGHEQKCNYRVHQGDVFQNVNDMIDDLASATIADSDYGGDPEELVQCKFEQYGCMVKMPRRRKYIHEQKCNYRNYQGDVDNEFNYRREFASQLELDPNEQVECKWSEYGCRVKPKRYRKQIHEDKCNYRIEALSM